MSEALDRRVNEPEDRRASDPVDPPARRGRPTRLRAYELIVVVPLLVWLVASFLQDPSPFRDWRILVWAAAIAVVDLLPVRGSSEMAFSLSFPIELSAALTHIPAVAALIALLGAADRREVRGELPPLKALYIRGQIAWSVAVESAVFHSMASLDHWKWYELGPAVLAAALVGYGLNVLVVADYAALQSGSRSRRSCATCTRACSASS